MSGFIDAICATMHAMPQAAAIIELGRPGQPERRIHYGELEQASRAIAQAIAGEFGPGATVGLVASNSPQWIMADLALLLGDFVEVPVPLAFSASQAAHLLSACSVVLADDEGCSRIERWREDAGRGFPGLTLRRIATLCQSRGRDDAPLPARRQGDRVCKIIHTSGTTSAPKGVRIRAHGLDALVASLWRHADAADYARYLNLVPFSLLIEQVTALYLPLGSGGCVLLAPAGEAPLGEAGARVADKLQLMRDALPSAMTLPPSMVQALAAEAARLDRGDPGQLCRALFGRAPPPLIAAGGAPVDRDTLAELAARGIPVLQGYGLSENSSVVSWNSRADNRIGTVGRPLEHVRCRLAPDGELAIRGASLFAGYSGSDPSACHTDADGWLWSGDLATIDQDGFISIVGRKKNLIITAHGRNVSPEQAEASYSSVPGVAAVVLMGEGREALDAFVLAAAGADMAALHALLLRHGERCLSGVERASAFWFEPDSASLRARFFTVTGRPRRADIERYVRDRTAPPLHANPTTQEGVCHPN